MRSLVALMLLAVSACKPATQITFEIRTDFPCEQLNDVTLTAAIDKVAERGEFTKITKACANDGTGAFIGTYAVIPKDGDASLVVGFKVVGAVDPGISASSCTADNKYAGCIVGRRRIGFVAGRNLTVPITLYNSCKGVDCDGTSSCNSIGTCVTSRTDETKCDNDVCVTPKTSAGNVGLPCLNDGVAMSLACRDNTTWCTMSNTGERNCASAPINNGISFQCRDLRDCGAHLQCIAGTAGILARCSVTATLDDTIICSPSQLPSPCPTGPSGCGEDAGAGLRACLRPRRTADAGVFPGIACPASAAPDGGTRCVNSFFPWCDDSHGAPTCASTGHQCWTSADCLGAGEFCFRGAAPTDFNACATGPTASNPVAICDTALGDSSCPNNLFCQGSFNGAPACTSQCIPGFPDCYGTGKDGDLHVLSGTLVGVNRSSAVWQSSTVGASSITVLSNAGFQSNDLLMVWQTQGAPVPSEGNSEPFSIIDAGVGYYEVVRAASISGSNVINLRSPLRHAYTTPGAQVVMVPEYVDVTIDADGGLVADAWRANSVTSGGILAFLASGDVINNGTIDARGIGFFGGNNIPSMTLTGCTALDGLPDSNGGAPKGEGVFVGGPAQTAGMGRVGNGGGGGSCLNAGGGGGSHIGAGGRGGKSIASDGTRDVGGWGGGPVTYGPEQLIFGGAGGAGQPDSQASTRGGRGGGVILIAARSISGSGSIDARAGLTGTNLFNGDTYSSYADGAQGAGAGGSVSLYVAQSLECRELTVAGGIGYAAKDEGGGGGGGGGGLVRTYVGNHRFDSCPVDVSGGFAKTSPYQPQRPGTGGGDGRWEKH